MREHEGNQLCEICNGIHFTEGHDAFVAERFAFIEPARAEAREKNKNKEWHWPQETLEGEAAIEKAEDMLSHVGLELKDLAGKQVLDIGAGHSLLERVGKETGINPGIVSLDRRRANLSKRPELTGRVLANARALPFKDKKFDLIYVSAAPPLTANNKSFFEETVNEIERVLTENGEARFTSTDLAFLHYYLRNERIWDLCIRSPDLTSEEREELDDFRNRVREASIEYLRNSPHNIEIRQSYRDRLDGEEQYYWILRKGSASQNEGVTPEQSITDEQE